MKGVFLEKCRTEVVIQSKIAVALPPVDADEVAFAMALFVSAANGRIYAPNIGVSGFPTDENLYELIEAPLATEEGTPGAPAATTDFAPLSRAVSVLWHHYKGDVRQRTIWCRVVAFHAMMGKTRGAVVQRWTVEHDDDPSVNSLHAAVVNAVARAPLSEFGEFDTTAFLRCAERFEHDSLLMASSGLAAPSNTYRLTDGTPGVLGKLRAPLEGLMGSLGLRALISRAIETNCVLYPWLKAASLTSEGFEITATCLNGKPSKDELAQGESAVTTSLLKSLRCLVGEGVAAYLLSAIFGGGKSQA